MTNTLQLVHSSSPAPRSEIAALPDIVELVRTVRVESADRALDASLARIGQTLRARKIFDRSTDAREVASRWAGYVGELFPGSLNPNGHLLDEALDAALEEYHFATMGLIEDPVAPLRAFLLGLCKVACEIPLWHVCATTENGSIEWQSLSSPLCGWTAEHQALEIKFTRRGVDVMSDQEKRAAVTMLCGQLLPFSLFKQIMRGQ